METEIKDKTQEPNLIVFSKQNYTALEKDIFTLAVSQLDTGLNVEPDLWNKLTDVTISASMLQEISEKSYERIKDVCISLQKKSIVIENKEKEEFETITAFPRIKYKKGLIKLTMFADVAKNFLELKNGYAEYYIKESLSLEQFNKKRFYEMFSSYKKRHHPVWTVYDNELKFYLGMEETEYKGRPKQFDKQIIHVCINAINDLTSISVKYTRQKDSSGWFTTFTVTDKRKIESKKEVFKPLDEKSQRLVERLKGIGIIRNDLVKIIVEEKQTACWNWLAANKDNITNKAFRSTAGTLLVHLGLAESKKPTQKVKVKEPANEK